MRIGSIIPTVTRPRFGKLSSEQQTHFDAVKSQYAEWLDMEQAVRRRSLAQMPYDELLRGLFSVAEALLLSPGKDTPFQKSLEDHEWAVVYKLKNDPVLDPLIWYQLNQVADKAPEDIRKAILEMKRDSIWTAKLFSLMRDIETDPFYKPSDTVWNAFLEALELSRQPNVYMTAGRKPESEDDA